MAISRTVEITLGVGITIIILSGLIGAIRNGPSNQTSPSVPEASQPILRPGDTQLVSDNMAQMPGDILGSRLHLQIDQSNPAVVGLTIKNGEIVCGNSDDIYVQFDGGPTETYTCRETQESQESFSNGPVYINESDQLVVEARKASRISISPQIMGKGRVTFTFSTSN